MATARLTTTARPGAARAGERGDPSQAWAPFLERYTPRSGPDPPHGIRRRDADGRLRARLRALCGQRAAPPGVRSSRGAMVSWLAIVARRVAVDWVTRGPAASPRRSAG